ncbi:hypothetical protein [Streptomyces sp. NPDC003077]|uniref:hypothetical protein n=1 Tax=Streptomyces sp. NPDC003077 TaxID=3154443 RepID=UPI00339E8FB8
MFSTKKRRTGVITALLATGAGLALGLSPQVATAAAPTDTPRTVTAEHNRDETCITKTRTPYRPAPHLDTPESGILFPGVLGSVTRRTHNEDGDWALFASRIGLTTGWVQAQNLHCED